MKENINLKTNIFVWYVNIFIRNDYKIFKGSIHMQYLPNVA